MAVKAVYFDLDGTLYSYNRYDAEARKAVAAYCKAQFGLSEEETNRRIRESIAAVKARLGSGAPATHSRLLRFQHMMKEMGQDVFPYARILYDIYWETMLTGMTPEDGMWQFLAALRRKGIRIYIATNMTSYIQYRKVQKLGIESLVEDLISSEEAGIEKPDGRFFGYCREKARLAPEECAFIGDNYKFDYLGSTAAGMRGILYDPDSLAKEHTDVPANVPRIRDFRDTEKNMQLLGIM
ncbi:MAG: HAD family hydrolase [Eubacterium sp.]|nr:HAD family hydrolase [Eubacterium sp.]